MSPLTGTIALIAELFVLGWLSFQFTSGIVSVLHGAPYVPMERYRLDKLLAFGELNSRDVFCDLGSGDGRVVLTAVRDFHVAQARGYEIAPWPYWKSRWKISRSGLQNVTVSNRSFFDADMKDVTCIYAYLFPKLIDRVAAAFARDLVSGTHIICPAFPIDLAKHPQFRLKKEEKIGTLTAYLYEKI